MDLPPYIRNSAPSREEALAVCVLSCVSALACLSVVILTSKYPILRQPPGRFVPHRSVFGMCNSFVLFGYALWVVVPAGEQTRARALDLTWC